MSPASLPNSPPEYPVRQTIGDFPELGKKLTLICGNCGRKGKYGVGRVLIDPDWVRHSPEDHASFDEAVSYSGIFFCKHCGADGPWKIPMMTRLGLLAMLAISSSERGKFGVQIGQLQMFDGTVVRTGAAAEAHLKQKLEEQPENAYIWGRLGNFYEHNRLVDRAKAAFEQAVKLDPGEVESLYNLGCFRMVEGDAKGAAECFEAVVRHAREASRTPAELRENMVRDSLEHLFDLHQESAGEIPFPPKFDAPVQAKGEGPEVIALMDLDLSSREGWDILTAVFLTGKVPEPIRQREANRIARGAKAKPPQKDSPSNEPPDLESSGTIREAKRPGRNDTCPCGSGKKYKRCCLPR